MVENIPIIDVDYGIASNYGDFIEMNRKLWKYPKLRKAILEHEERHTSGKYTKEDFKNDFQSKNSYFFDTLKFCMANKEGFINFFPFMYSYYSKEWTYNTSSVYPGIFFGIIFVLFFKITLHLPIFYLILLFLAFILIANGIFIIVTHLYVKSTNYTRNKADIQ